MTCTARQAGSLTARARMMAPTISAIVPIALRRSVRSAQARGGDRRGDRQTRDRWLWKPTRGSRPPEGPRGTRLAAELTVCKLSAGGNRIRTIGPALVEGLSAVADERCRTDKLDGVIKHRWSRETTMSAAGPFSTAISFSAGPIVRIRFPPAQSRANSVSGDMKN